MNAARKLPEPAMELFPDFAPSLRPPSGDLRALDAPLAEISPGVWVSGLPAFEVPSHVLCRLVPVADAPGQFSLVPDGPFPGYVRMGDDIGHRLGVVGLSATTMRRLLCAGFVDHIRAAPGCIYISIESLLEHFSRTSNDCARDKSYWTAKRIEEWRAVCEATSNIED